MSRLGPINFGQKHENPFIGRDWGEMRNYSEAVANEIDREVSSIINAQYDVAKQILLDHMDVFERVALILLEVETLDGEEFLAIINDGADLETIRKMQERKLKAEAEDSVPITEDGEKRDAPSGEQTPVTEKVAAA
jgi:cell division protease FtsH